MSRPGQLHIGIAGPVTVRDLLPWLPDAGEAVQWASTGSPLMTTLINNLLQRGVKVSVFTNDEAIETLQQPWIRFDGEKLSLYVIPRRRRGWRFANGRPGRMLDFFRLERRGLTDAMVTAQPDMVHAHWSYEYAAAALAAGRPHLITCHDAPWVILRHMPDAYRLFRLLMAYRVLSRARQLTVVSPYLLAPIERMTKGEIRLVPNPTPAWVFELQPALPRVLPSASAAPQFVMLLNGWVPRKNPQPGMRAMGILAASFPAARMHLIGPDYDSGGPAARWADAEGLSHLFIFHGSLSHREAMNILGSSHVLVHPAVEESFGLTLAEAMAQGVPVVGGSSSGAVPWVVGDAGELVDVRDHNAIASAMLRLISDADQYSRASAAGMARSRALFSEASVTDAYLQCYEAVLNDKFSSIGEEAPVTA